MLFSKLNKGKAAGMGGVTNEIVNGGGAEIVEWYVHLFKLHINIANPPLD